MTFYRLATFFYLIFIFPLKLLVFKKTRTYFWIRIQNARQKNKFPNKETYVFHASSGEAEYAFPLIRELKKQNPQCQVVMTYFSNSYIDVIAKNPEVDLAIPLPLDIPGPTRSFLTEFKPVVFFISRTDLWPEMLTQCQNLKIPVALFSRTQVPIRNPFKKLYYRWIYKKINLISVVTPEDKQNILSLDPTAEVHIHGDSRWDQVQYKLSLHPKVKYLKPTFVAGSIWPEDFNYLSLAWDKKFGQLILVPHELDTPFLKKINTYFSNKNYIVKFLTQLNLQTNFDHLNIEFDVLIVDQFGVLPRLYFNSYGAFIGGSFKRKVHSVMEALACNTPVIVGPYHKNNREAEIFKHIPIYPNSNIKAVNVVSSSNDIQNLIHQLINEPPSKKFEFTKVDTNISRNILSSIQLKLHR